jgi:hypothetical protein
MVQKNESSGTDSEKNKQKVHFFGFLDNYESENFF